MTSRATRRLQILGALLLLTTLTTPTASPQDHTDWPRWRGPDQQGRSGLSPGPISWSAEGNIRWATEIPGRGHSSPVVSDGRVYLTTAYEATRGGLVGSTMPWLILALVAIFSALAARLVVQQCSVDLTGSGGYRRILPLAFFCIASAAVLLWVLFGHHALDYDRCEIRSWLGSSILLSSCFMLSEFRTPSSSAQRVLMGAGSMIFAAFVLLAIPYRDHALTDGFLSKKTMSVFLIAAFPFLVGASSMTRYILARRRSGTGARGMKRRPVFSFTTVAPVLVMIVGVWLILSTLRTPGIKIASGNMHWLRPAAGLPVYLVCGVWLLCSLLAEPRSPAAPTTTRLSTLVIRLGAVLSFSFATLAAAAFLASRSVESSEYLTYHLADPEWQSRTWQWSFLAIVAAGALALLIQIRQRNRAGLDPHLRNSFRFVCLSLGILAFVETNYINAKKVMTRAILAFDAENGDLLWACEAIDQPKGTFHKSNSLASPTPIVHDGSIYSYFGDAGVVSTANDGTIQWVNRDVLFHSVYGAGASPVASDGHLILVNSSPEDPYIAALATSSGELSWKQPMKGKPSYSGNSRTPLIAEIDGRETLLIWGYAGLEGHDPTTGEKLWSHDVGEALGDMVASLVSDDQRFYLAGPRKTTAVLRADLGSSESPIAWTTRVGGANVASPVVVDGLLFMVSDRGIATCLDSRSGRVLWRQRLAGEYRASPTAIGDFIYFSNTDGRTTIVAADEEYRPVGENLLTEGIFGSLAPAADKLFIRSEKHLFCVEPPGSGSVPG